MEDLDRGSLEHVRAPNLTKFAADDDAIPDAAHGITSSVHDFELNPHMDRLMDWMQMEVVVRLRDLDHKLDNLSAKVDGCRGFAEDSMSKADSQARPKKVSRDLSSKFSSRSKRSQQPNNFGGIAKDDTCDAPSGSIAASPSRSPKFSMVSEIPVQGPKEYLMNIALWIWTIMHDQDSSFTARCYAATMRYLVWISVIITLTQTVKPPPIPGFIAAKLETMFDSIFLLEIAIRFAVCPNRRRFLQSAYNVLDIVAAVPLIMRASIGFMPIEEDKDGCASTCVILLYIVPIIRILKTLRTFRKFHLLLSAFVLAFEALPVLLFTLVVILMIYSTLIYWVEPRSNVASLPTAMYFTIITMTTVGYGDISPISNGGHVVVALCTITGVLYMAMPIGIIGSAFTEVWQRRDRILLTQRIRENLLQWGHTVEDIPALFEQFDTDGDGELHIREFRRLMIHLRIGLGDDRIMELFRNIDTNAGGSIDAAEFMRMLFPETYHALYDVGGDRRPVAQKKWTKRWKGKWETSKWLTGATSFVTRVVSMPRRDVQDGSVPQVRIRSVLSEAPIIRTVITEQNEEVPDIGGKMGGTADEFFEFPSDSLLSSVISEDPADHETDAKSERPEEPNTAAGPELSTAKHELELQSAMPSVVSAESGEPDAPAKPELSDASVHYELMQSI